ncbi:MAG: hypothetical protein R3B84_16405 [Zavarzinella sp.]
MRNLIMIATVCGLTCTSSAVADTYSYYYYSLEWVVDASDSIVEATVVPGKYKGNPIFSTATVKSVDRVLKSINKAGPVKDEVLATHVAGVKENGAHQVLLFTRPDPKNPGKREVVYCIYLNKVVNPDHQKFDPFLFLPCHTSSWQRLEFSSWYCLAADAKGKTYTDPKTIIELVEKRIKQDPKRLISKGNYLKYLPKGEDTDDHNLLVPQEK